jgi:type IV secretory pathway component VirB8
LVKGGLTNGDYSYRTFHAAMREKFSDYPIKQGYDLVEAIYSAIISEDFEYNINISDKQVKRGRKYTAYIKHRLLSAINPNIA